MSQTARPSQTVPVVKITMNGGGATSIMTVPKPDDARTHGLYEELALFLAEGSRGESMEITLDEMTQAEYDALPEFVGW